MACKDLEISKVDIEKRPNAEEVKQSIYDPSMITNSILDNLFSDSASAKDQYKILFEGDKPVIPYKSVKDATKSLKYFNEDKKPFGEKVGVVDNGQDARNISIALSHLLSARKSEADVARKYNLTPKETAAITDPDSGFIPTAYSNMARTIGRDILKTQGYRLIPKSPQGLENAIKIEQRAGETAIQELIARELVVVEENGTVVNRNFKKENPDNATDTRYSKKKLLNGVKTIFIKELSSGDEDVDSQNSSMLAATRKLINPSNSAVPSAKPKPINEQAQDMALTPKYNKVLEDIQNIPMQITPFMKTAIEDLMRQVGDKGTTKGRLMALADYVSGNPKSTAVFGTLDMKELQEYLQGDDVGLEQEFGKSLSKVMQFNNIFDSWDALQDDIHYSFKTAGQNRLFTLEQTLSYQADAFISRPMLGSATEQALDTNEKVAYMVAFISDETGLSIEQILGTEATEADKFIEAFTNRKDGDPALGLVLGIGEAMEKTGKIFPSISKSAWEAADFIQAISDIREGLKSKDQVVRTRFIPKPDATASGALITVEQAARYGGVPLKVLDDLENDPKFNDLYQLATSELQTRLNGFTKNLKSVDAIAKADAQIMDKIQDIAKALGGTRNLIKLPFTKYIYGQRDDNNALEISKEIATKLIITKNEKLMKKILGTEKIPKEAEERRLSLIDALNKDNGISQTLVKIVDETTGEQLFKRQGEALESIHTLLEQARFSQNSTYNQIKILPPLATLDIGDKADTDYMNQRRQFGTIIEKFQETVIQDENGNLTTIKKRFPNVNSIKVLLQHMVDSAIMFRAIERTNKQFPNYKDGLMLNHDSIGSSVEYAMVLEKNYKEEISIVNKEYDFIEAALRELKFARENVFKDQSEITTVRQALQGEVLALNKEADSIVAEIAGRPREETLDLRRKLGETLGKLSTAEAKIDTLATLTIDEKLATQMDEKIAEIEAELPAQITTKKAALDNLVLESSFGVKERILKEANKKVSFTKPKVTESVKPQNLDSAKVITDMLVRVGSVNPRLAKLGKIAHNNNPEVIIQVGEENSYDLATNTITVTKRPKPEAFLHELVHANTAQKIETSSTYRKKVQSLYNQALKASPEVMAQFENMNEADRLHEFMAAGISNEQMKTELSKIPFGKKILNNIKKLILSALGVTTETYNTVYGRLVEAFTEGEYNNEKGGDIKLGFIDVVTTQPKVYTPLKKRPNLLEKSAREFEYVDKKVANYIDNVIDLTIDTAEDSKILNDAHSYLLKNSSVYKNTLNAIHNQWKNNTLIGKVKFYLDLDDKAKRKGFNVLQTQALYAEERKTQFEIDKMNSLHKEFKDLFSETETETLYSVMTETGISALGKNDVFIRLVDGKLTIDEAIAEVKEGVERRLVRKAEGYAESLSALYVDKVANNSAPMPQQLRGDFKLLVEQLTALESLKKVTNSEKIIKKIGSSKKHREATTKLFELVAANKALDEELFRTIAVNTDAHNGSLNHQIFDNNIQLKYVTPKSINKALNEDLGWKVLRRPSKGVAGIIYRDAGDITYQSGLGTSLQLQPNLTMDIGKSFSTTKNNSIKNSEGFGSKVVFTNKELKAMGLIQDPIASLVKGYSHRMMLLETEGIRRELVNEYTFQYTSNNSKQIVEKIKEGTHDWYISLPEGITIDQLDPVIRRQYKASDASSDAGGFKNEVTLVRKDMSDFIEGYREIQIGLVNTTLNKLFGVLKKSILLQKIHWVVVAPVKIALDATSNVTYLLSRNVPLYDIIKKTPKITRDMIEMTKLRENLLHAEFRNRSHPSEGNQKLVDKYEREIKNHRLATAYYKGFIQSIAIDLFTKNENTSQGLQKDVGNLLSNIFRNDDKSLNIAGKAIMTIAKKGINGEDILVKLADLLGQDKSKPLSSGIAEHLAKIAEHIKDIKEKDSVEQYIQEYMATPGSALVTVGSVLVQTPDVISKVLLFEYLVDAKVREFRRIKKKKPSAEELAQMNEDASIEAVTSFIDYKMNIPRELRFLEQVGITSFISFWARIQKVLYTSIRNNPVNAMITITLNEIFNLQGATIWDANVVDKFGNGSLIGGPNPGIDVILPTKLFGN